MSLTTLSATMQSDSTTAALNSAAGWTIDAGNMFVIVFSDYVNIESIVMQGAVSGDYISDAQFAYGDDVYSTAEDVRVALRDGDIIYTHRLAQNHTSSSFCFNKKGIGKITFSCRVPMHTYMYECITYYSS